MSKLTIIAIILTIALGASAFWLFTEKSTLQVKYDRLQPSLDSMTTKEYEQTDQLEELESRLEGLKKGSESISQLKTELKEAKNTIQDLTKDKELLEDRLEELKESIAPPLEPLE